VYDSYSLAGVETRLINLTWIGHLNMPLETPSNFLLSNEVSQAVRLNLPVVALESAVITHGLPYPENVNLATEMEDVVRSNGCVPATIAFLDGQVNVGLSRANLERLASESRARKISRRDIGIALARHDNGGTTVAGTLIIAKRMGFKVFATGGIGGVHRNAPFDISADLPELGRSPLVVVCAGAKAILDLPNTLEYLETMGVPVIGYQTDEFPAFYSRASGLKVNASASSPGDVARIARGHWEMGLESAILVCVPPPEGEALPKVEIDQMIDQAIRDAERQKIHGAALTPFLLNRVSQLTHGSSMRTNLALLHNNAAVAAQIAAQLVGRS
jgi:pseudouridylate synthase